MPVLLEGPELSLWLDRGALPQSKLDAIDSGPFSSASQSSAAAVAAACLRSFDPGLVWHPCTPRMNKIDYLSPDCALPIKLATPITNFFKKDNSNRGASSPREERTSGASTREIKRLKMTESSRCGNEIITEGGSDGHSDGVACSACTFFNEPLALACAICDSLLPSSAFLTIS